jgi:hypothetical protein
MHKIWIRNIMLFAVALLLLFDLAARFSQPVHAAGKTQYKAVYFEDGAKAVQQVLDQHSAQGWDYAGTAGTIMIFKK